MAKAKVIIEQEPEVLDPEVLDPDEAGNSGDGDASKRGKTGDLNETKHGKGRRMRTHKNRKTKSNPRASAGSGFFGDMNVTKIALIAAGGALLWDYLTAGQFIGVFGPNGFVSGLFRTAPQSPTIAQAGQNPTNPGPFNPRPMPTPEPLTNPGPGPAPNTSNYADYLKTITVTPTGAVQAGDTAVGGDTGRDLAKFNSDNRYRNSTLSRAAQGAPYSIAIVRAAGVLNNWDQWNWHRGQNGGTPIDIDALGLSDKRGTVITLDQFLAVAGVDPSESGMGSLSNTQTRYTGLEWLM